MKKGNLIRGLSLALAGLMVVSLAGCNKKSASVADDAKKNAKNAVFKMSKEITPDFSPTGCAGNEKNFILMRTDQGVFQYAIGDKDGNLSGQADLPAKTSEDCVGECCFELFLRIMSILDNEYHILAEALYGAPITSKREPMEMLRILRELHDKPLVVNGEPEG